MGLFDNFGSGLFGGGGIFGDFHPIDAISNFAGDVFGGAKNIVNELYTTGKSIVLAPLTLGDKFLDKGAETVQSLGQSAEKAISNVGSSAGNAVSDIGSSLTFPLTIGAAAIAAFFFLKK